ncbi:cytochrome P450 [Hypoxylon trugodes]|uniref:cytochrome P450 n=1 Tax=Hypoxylon trugodes TaxID=326681 RepID=UPI00219976D7|nr:cytochrome P450 [Hypoxylon trugodes]KAI1386114.1 cytochrome P450 [Hypoxylon trugodes]
MDITSHIMWALDMLPLVALYGFSIMIALVLFAVGYRAILHPLSKYPGPFIAKLSNGYSGYHALKQDLHLVTYRDYLKYGSVFRHAPNRLVFNTATAVRDIYLNPGVNKARIYEKTQFNPQKNIFGTLDRERHRQKRKIYGQVLSDRSLRTFEPTMSKEIDAFLGQLLKMGGKPANMSLLCERLTADVAGNLAFGQQLHTLLIFSVCGLYSLRVAKIYRLAPFLSSVIRLLIVHVVTWPNLSVIWPIFSRLYRKSGRAFSDTIRDIIQKRMALPKDAKHDFYSVATSDPVLENENLRQSELWAEAVFIMPAGGATTPAALSALFFYLSRHPTVYARLAREIRTTFAETAIQSGPQPVGCTYLRAVIDETLRVAPPFLGTFWREPHASYTEPFIVDGHVIPQGTAVGVSPYCLMHNEAYFPEPFEFRPERWLGSEEQRAAMRGAFAPFALGDTGCLGKSMAYLEISLVIAKTLWYFDFEKAPGEAGKLGEGEVERVNGRGRTDEYQLRDLAVAGHDGPNLGFKPRGDYWKALINDEVKVKV